LVPGEPDAVPEPLRALFAQLSSVVAAALAPPTPSSPAPLLSQTLGQQMPQQEQPDEPYAFSDERDEIMADVARLFAEDDADEDDRLAVTEAAKEKLKLRRALRDKIAATPSGKFGLRGRAVK
jgi:hypothetical protein